MQKPRLALIYIDPDSLCYRAFADTLFGRRLPYIYARNVEMHHMNYLHAEAWQERKPQEGMWMAVSIPHQYILWILQDPLDEKQVGFCKNIYDNNGKLT